MVNHRTLTSAMIDSRDFLAAKRRADTEVLMPAGPKIAFTGGLDCNDHRLIWDKLDKVHAKHPDMVLLHGGSPKGAERIAARWADHRKVPQIAFKPDWTSHAKAAPFKRNDQMLDVLPIGVIVFPGTGIQENLADKARKLGIPVWKLAATAARKRRYCRTKGTFPSLTRRRYRQTNFLSRHLMSSAIPMAAPWWWWRRDPCNLCHGTHHHDHHGILLNIVGLGIFCWALFTLAVHALPFFVGMTAGMYTYRSWNRSRSAPSSLASSRPCFTTLGRSVLLLRRALSHRPSCHWAIIRGSGGTRRL